MFSDAEHAGAILFFDEADALFRVRFETECAHSRYAAGTADYLVQKVQGHRGVVIWGVAAEYVSPPAPVQIDVVWRLENEKSEQKSSPGCRA
jgi:SpoVK/Ycf46/Vps4 family AAA+-type ATPase